METAVNSSARKRTVGSDTQTTTAVLRGAKKAKLPSFIAPQLATLVDSVPEGDAWLHEIKLDGYRLLCRIDNSRVQFLTRQAQDWTASFKALVDSAKKLPVRRALLDGEVVALDERGNSSFQRLQNSLKGGNRAPLIYFAFDLLHLDGRDLRCLPLLTRKKILRQLLDDASNGRQDTSAIRYSEHWIGRGQALYDESCRRGLEGIIAKRVDAPYRSERSRDWLKIKCLKRQEFVIGGFSEPAGSRSGLGALLLGVFDHQGDLRYAGRVGTGFTQKSLADLRARLDPLVRATAPFVDPPKGYAAKGVHWVEPKLVGEVAFTEWTEDNLLRHPSFCGLREDKPAIGVVREEARHIDTAAATKASANASIAGITLTHPDRLVYPEQNLTKRELATYYEAVADRMLPHVRERLLTLVRCPQGQKKQCFYQRHARESLREPVHSMAVKEGGSVAPYVWIDSTDGLIALLQMGVLEIHTWGARIDHLEQPDRLTFDLDPDPALPWARVREAAELLRGTMEDFGFGAFVKTTGGKGLHVVVPLTPKLDWDGVKRFAGGVAKRIAREAPELYTATASKAKRSGKIYIDYLRNAWAATAICAYSTRAAAGAPVSVPLDWKELADDVRGDYFTVRNVPGRLARLSRDPWHGYEAARVPVTAGMLKTLG
jgi:bifunctional non-homologous end joining protein LigD